MNKAAVNYSPLFIIRDLKKNMVFMSKHMKNLSREMYNKEPNGNYRTKKSNK